MNARSTLLLSCLLLSSVCSADPLRLATTSTYNSGLLDYLLHQIGKLLSRCSDGADGIWPHESVRFVIEWAGSEELIRAIASGKLFSGGVTSRHPYSGGKLERNLAAQFVNDAQDIELIYPRTAQLLRSIAQSYECEAEREDRSVEAGWQAYSDRWSRIAPLHRS